LQGIHLNAIISEENLEFVPFYFWNHEGLLLRPFPERKINIVDKKLNK
jgi:hypothetical protein